jgi:DNA topoisomerase IB
MQQNLFNVLAAQNQLMTNMGLMVLPKDGVFSTHAYSFSGLNEIYESFMLDCAGAAEIPVTKLFGRSPAGMNATGESDLQNYYDSIGQKQEALLRPPLEKLLPVICTSLWGSVPGDLHFKFPSAQSVPMERLAEVSGKKTSSVVEAWNSDLLTKKQSVKELRQMSEETGMYSNISDEDIATIPNKYQSELGGMGESGPEELGPEGETQQLTKEGNPNTDTGVAKPSKPGVLRKMVQELKDTIRNLRASLGNRSEDPAERDKVKRESQGQLEELRKAIRSDMQHLQGDTVTYTKDEPPWEETEHPRDTGGKFTAGNKATSVAMKPLKSTEAIPDYISRLKVPPAWQNIRYNPDPHGDLLVVGVDNKGRTQAIYNERFVATQAQIKYERVKELSRKYRDIKAENDRNRKSEDASTRNRADCMGLIIATGIRPGSTEETGAKVKAYGATTLEGRHVVKEGDNVRLRFVGKKGVQIDLPIEDTGLARMVAKRAKIAGPTGQLFAGVNHKSLREYAKGFDGGRFSPKDFRTYLGTTTAEKCVKAAPVPKTPVEYKRAVRDVAKIVASKLGNTPVVCLQSYINPAIFARWRGIA